MGIGPEVRPIQRSKSLPIEGNLPRVCALRILFLWRPIPPAHLNLVGMTARRLPENTSLSVLTGISIFSEIARRDNPDNRRSIQWTRSLSEYLALGLDSPMSTEPE